MGYSYHRLSKETYMKTRNVSKILGLLAFVLGVISVLLWFGPAFDSDGQPGSLFQFAFAIEDRGYEVNPYLILAFAILLLGSLSCLGIGSFKGKGAITLGVISVLLLLAGGVLTLLVKTFFMLNNPNPTPWTDGGLGTGTICSAVFAFIGVIFAFLGSRSASHKE